MKMATGKYISFLDDDDIYLPGHLQCLVSILETSTSRVAYTDAYRVIQEPMGDRLKEISVDVPLSRDFDRNRLFICNYIPLLTLMLERSLLAQSGFFDETMGILEDWDLILRLSHIADFYHIPKATCKYYVRQGDAGHVNASLSGQMRGFRQVYDKHSVDQPSVLQGRIEMLQRLINEAPQVGPVRI
jgi:hypothetical protein